MWFALGLSVGCAVAVLLIFAVAQLVKQKPTGFMVQAHQETLDLLTEANRLRMCQTTALENIGARLESPNNHSLPCVKDCIIICKCGEAIECPRSASSA